MTTGQARLTMYDAARGHLFSLQEGVRLLLASRTGGLTLPRLVFSLTVKDGATPLPWRHCSILPPCARNGSPWGGGTCCSKLRRNISSLSEGYWPTWYAPSTPRSSAIV